MFPTLPLVASSVKAEVVALSYQILCGQTMNVPYSPPFYLCPRSQELKGTILTAEVRGSSVEAGFHLVYIKEQFQK